MGSTHKPTQEHGRILSKPKITTEYDASLIKDYNGNALCSRPRLGSLVDFILTLPLLIYHWQQVRRETLATSTKPGQYAILCSLNRLYNVRCSTFSEIITLGSSKFKVGKVYYIEVQSDQRVGILTVKTCRVPQFDNLFLYKGLNLHIKISHITPVLVKMATEMSKLVDLV